MKNPQYDLILYGATGFVGQIMSHYLSELYGTDGARLRWAIAGRSKEKLRLLRNSLGVDADGLPVIVAEASDEAALEALCGQTLVVVSAVGPYALYGESMVRACVRSGTDYCDLTGELQWIRKMISRYDNEARQSGARMVHCCGLDSLPSDMGVWFLQQHVVERFGKPAEHVKMRVKAMRGGGISGGTAASMMNLMKEASRDDKVRKELADPYSLCPSGHGFSVRQPDVRSPSYDEDFSAWTAPFLMAPINVRIVLRSHVLAGAPYGQQFRYEEAVLTGRGLKGRTKAYSNAAGTWLLLLAGAISPVRLILKRYILPKPGDGPSPEQQESGYYDFRFHGTTSDGHSLQVKVTGDRDPGYGSTARMVGQSAVCLALDLRPDQLKEYEKHKGEGGFLTPSTLFDNRLLKRLTDYAGMSFEVVV